MARQKARPPEETAAIPVLEAEPEPEPAAPPAVEQPLPPRPEPAQSPQSSAWAPFAGGVAAAALGFGLSLVLLPEGWRPVSGPDPQVAEQAERITALEVQIARLNEPPVADPRIPALEAGLAETRAALSALPVPQTGPDEATLQRLGSLEARLKAMEEMPVGDTGVAPAAIAAMRSQISALESRITSQQGDQSAALADIEAAAKAAEDRLAQAAAEAAALQETAEATAKAAAISAAIGRVRSAMDSGVPLTPALTELTDAGLTLPPALTDHAAGLPTLRSLQASFPDAARAALEASLRANPGESWTDRLGTFLQSQIGARSLTPQEGDDPDAILSRAEAALGTGDLQAALTEIVALPPEGQAALADWRAAAQSRIDAEAALATLSGGAP